MNTKLLYSLGRPFSPFYSALMRGREHCYRKGLFRSTSFAQPVISVGNLTMGGTGKTPMVKYIATLLQKKGYTPAIISRGYGGATKERINIVSDGHELFLDAHTVGDEPRMLAESLPGVMVLTGVVRRLPAAKAVKMGADVLLLDDGFQHLSIARDLDLVLFNGDMLAGNSRVFPGGDLREPVKALNRCHGFVLTGIDETNSKRAGKFAEILQQKFPDKPVFTNGSQISGITELQANGSRKDFDLKLLAQHRCYGFCGIARPQGFQKTLETLQTDIAGFHALADHHGYHDNEVRKIIAGAKKARATCLLCTEKDLVKLTRFTFPLPLYALCMEVNADPALEQFLYDQIP
jgi:tetraacyldisaccharide 4'-kinase